MELLEELMIDRDEYERKGIIVHGISFMIDKIITEGMQNRK